MIQISLLVFYTALIIYLYTNFVVYTTVSTNISSYLYETYKPVYAGYSV